MNYGKLTDTIIKKVMLAIALINNPEITPEVRQFNLEILFREVGSAVYAKIYDMNAFDFGIEHTIGEGMDDRYYASRRTVGDTCKWCRSLAAENVENPPAEFFHRHAGCDCEIITKGYKSRNGLLQNYVKPKDR